MGKRKKHHYIPKFYLKKFSINYDGKLIGLYNYSNNIFTQNAQIRHQACEEYLYGRDDEIEEELAKLENSISKMFYYWTDEKILIPPPENSAGFSILKRYILYQLYRTPKAGNAANELVNQAAQLYINLYHPEKKDKAKEGKFGHPDPVLLALLFAYDKEHLLNFLTCKFIINLSYLPFLTSDAPVIMYNQLMEDIGLYTGATALPVKGLQIFFPIHPRVMICLYDSKVYNCGDKNEYVSTESIEDIHQLNSLQYINSFSQLFFDETISKEYIEDIITQCKDIKKAFTPIGYFTKKENRNFYFSSFEDASIRLSLSFFSLLDNAKDFEHEIAALRHPSLNRK